MVEKEKMLQEAVEAGQSGDLAKARRLLLTLLEIDNQEALYWLLMSTCVDSKEEREYCLHNVLKLDPDNSAAKHDLKLMGAQIPDQSEDDELDNLSEDWQTSEIAAPNIEKKKRPPKVDPWPLRNILGAIGLGALLIGLLSYAVSNGIIDLSSDTDPTPNSVPGILIASPSSIQSTNVAEVSPSPEASETAELVAIPRNPQDLLDNPHTATPFFVTTPHPDSPPFDQGMQAFQDENWTAAIDNFRQHLSSDPNSVDTEYYVGLAYLQLGENQNALDAFNRAIALAGQFAPAYLGRAHSSIALNLQDSSIITDLNTAILLDESYFEALIVRGRFFLEQGNPSSALQDLIKAENISPQSVEIHALKAKSFLALFEYEQARISGEYAFDLDITLLSNYLVLAEIYLELSEANAVIGIMQSYLNYEAIDGKAWEMIGIAYTIIAETDLALSSFDKALENNPTLAEANYFRGLIHLQAGESSAAISLFRNSIQSLANWFESHIALAEALLSAGDPGAAFFEANSSSSFIENEEQQAAFHYWRASALEALGQAETAKADWISILSLPSESVRPEWLQAAREHSLSP